MKKMFALLFFVAMATTMISCSDSDDSGIKEYQIAKPLVMSKAEFRNSVAILPPQPIETSGKIYSYNDYIFVNDKFKGVHVIDNSDPANPQKISFIKIAGNVDISVKDDYLYADSLTDLVVLNISDVNNVEQVARLENVLAENMVWPVDAQAFDWQTVDYENEVMVGWEIETVRMTEEEFIANYGCVNCEFFGGDVLANAVDTRGGTGQGGSLARFKIVGDYLYAVDSHNINVFGIQDLANPQQFSDVFAGFDIETIFNRDNYLFLGSMRGMYIYDITEPQTPSLVSEFQHGTACDPVVVDDNYAYVTLRGGNRCGATESGLFIIDISTIENPQLKVMYPMDEPYGLGIQGDKLFVCDGASGLKVYDKSNVPDLPQLNHFKDIVTFDVIPLENSLLMVGEGTLYQYKYTDTGIEQLSQLQLD